MRQATIVHHIEHVEDHPERAYDDANLESVCLQCHNRLHPEKITKAAKSKRGRTMI